MGGVQQLQDKFYDDIGTVERDSKISTLKQNFDIKKIADTLEERKALVNAAKEKFSKLDDTAKDDLKNKCKEYFSADKNLAIIKDKSQHNTNNTVAAIGYLLTALETNNTNPYPKDVVKYFTNQFTEEVKAEEEVKKKKKETKKKSSALLQNEKNKKKENENENSTETAETNERLSEEIKNKQRHVITHLGLKSGNMNLTKDSNTTTNLDDRKRSPPDVYTRDGYKGIYKFDDNSADLVYISSAEEKKDAQRGKIFGHIPNQIYKFDENYTKIDTSTGAITSFSDKIEDKNDGNKGEKRTFVNGSSTTNTMNWMKDMNSEKYTYAGPSSWKSVKKLWEAGNGNSQDSNEGSAQQKASEKKETEEKKIDDLPEDKDLESMLESADVLNKLNRITKLEQKNNAIDEEQKINELKTEYFKLNQEYEKLKSKDTGGVLKLENIKQQRMREIEEEVVGIREQIKQLRSNESTDERREKKIGNIRERVVAKLESKIQDQEKLVKNGEGILSSKEYDKIARSIPLLTQILESQKVMLDLGESGCDYSRNDANQIVKTGDGNNITYTMDTYGRLIKHEGTKNNKKSSVVQFSEKLGNKSQEKRSPASEREGDSKNFKSLGNNAGKEGNNTQKSSEADKEYYEGITVLNDGSIQATGISLDKQMARNIAAMNFNTYLLGEKNRRTITHNDGYKMTDSKTYILSGGAYEVTFTYTKRPEKDSKN